jgi:hypothetical protein
MFQGTRMKRILIPTLATLLLAACATQGERVDQSKLGQLKPGVTTIADAENLLGKPESVFRHADGTTTLSYGFSSTTADGKSLIPIVGGFIGKGATSSIEYTALVFDKQGRYTTYSTYQRN